jgi:uncharacterized protein
MSLRLSRRRNIKNLTGRVDVRRTIRRSILDGGDPIDRAFSRKKSREYRLVIFIDVSGVAITLSARQGTPSTSR